MEKQKTALLTDIARLEIIETEVPLIGDGEVLVKVESVGICGSDVSYFSKGSTGVGKIQFPHSLGHECSGIVIKASQNSRFKPGDRVAVEPGVPCHACKHCLSGHYNRCENISFMSSARKMKYSDGAFSEYIVRPESSVFPIPDSISFDQGALLEPISVGYHAVQRSGIKAGQKAAILGCGPIAGCVLLVLRSIGIGSIIMTDIEKSRLKLMESLGASRTVDTNGMSVDDMKRLTGSIDVVFDTTCNEDAINSSLNWLEKGGTLVSIGVFTSGRFIDLHTLFLKELTLTTSFRYANTYPACISLIENHQLDPMPLVSHHFPLMRIQEAFDMATNDKKNVMKIIINC